MLPFLKNKMGGMFKRCKSMLQLFIGKRFYNAKEFRVVKPGHWVYVFTCVVSMSVQQFLSM